MTDGCEFGPLRSSSLLLQGEAGGGAAGAGYVVADYAGLAGAKHALAGAADGDWGGACESLSGNLGPAA